MKERREVTDRKNFKVFPVTLQGQEIYSSGSELLLSVKFSRPKVSMFFFPILETVTKRHVKKKRIEVPAE